MSSTDWARPFGLVYRDWLLGQAREEADAGCPRLRGMKSEEAMYFADLTETWDAERRDNLMGARIKWLFTGNYGYPPVPVSAQETAAEALWTPWSPAVSRSTKPWNPNAVEIRRAAGAGEDAGRGGAVVHRSPSARSSATARIASLARGMTAVRL